MTTPETSESDPGSIEELEAEILHNLSLYAAEWYTRTDLMVSKCALEASRPPKMASECTLSEAIAYKRRISEIDRPICRMGGEISHMDMALHDRRKEIWRLLPVEGISVLFCDGTHRFRVLKMPDNAVEIRFEQVSGTSPSPMASLESGACPGAGAIGGEQS